MILTGRRVYAVEAARMGLCSALVTVSDEDSKDSEKCHEATLSHGIAVAEEISKGGPQSISAALRAVMGNSQAAEKAAYESLMNTEDRAHALEQWARRSPPHFQGK
jgi:enoyl-CoA hydratase/carnithine racemase